MNGADRPTGRVAGAAGHRWVGLERRCRSPAAAAVLVATLIVLLPALGLVSDPSRHPGLSGEALRSLGPPPAANSTPIGNNSFNNTSSRLTQAISSFFSWFAGGLATLVGFVILTLLVGGILNYLLVGRKRGAWTPAEALAAEGPPPAPPPSPSGPTSGGGPP